MQTTGRATTAISETATAKTVERKSPKRLFDFFESRPAESAGAGEGPRPTRHFGMKAHVGVDSKTKIIHTAVA